MEEKRGSGEGEGEEGERGGRGGEQDRRVEKSPGIELRMDRVEMQKQMSH